MTPARAVERPQTLSIARNSSYVATAAAAGGTVLPVHHASTTGGGGIRSSLHGPGAAPAVRFIHSGRICTIRYEMLF